MEEALIHRLIFSLALAVAAGSAANSATLTAEGATGVNINGALYDVSFVDGTCRSVFDGCDAVSDFAFETKDAAKRAAEILLALINASPAFDSTPELANGCTSDSLCRIFTPFAVVGGSVKGVTVFNWANEKMYDRLASQSRSRSYDTSLNSSFAWAEWTPADLQLAPIPVPASGVLLGGMVIAGASVAYRRKQKQRVG